MSIPTSVGSSQQAESNVLPRSLEARTLVQGLLDLADRWRWWICALVVLFYLFGFTGQWKPESDSALYLSIGRSLALGHGYTYFGQPNHLAYAGLPWLIAATFRVFGLDNVAPILVIMWLLAWCTLAGVYTLFKLRMGRPTAVVVTAIVALSDAFFRYALEVRNDMPFIAGVMAVFVGYELIGWGRSAAREGVGGGLGGGEATSLSIDSMAHSRARPITGWVLIVIGLAVATVMRPVIWALLPTLVLAVIFSPARRQLKWKYLLIALLGAVVIAIFLILDPRRRGGSAVLGIYEDTVLDSLRSGQMFYRMFHLNLAAVLGPATTEALLGMRVGPVLDQIVAVTTIFLAVRLWRRQPLWALWVITTLLMMLAMLAIKRYYLPILPFLTLGAFEGIYWLNKKVPNRVLGNCICAGFLVVLVGSNAVRSVNYALQQHSIYVWAKGDRGAEYTMAHKLARIVDNHVPPEGVVLAPRGFGRVVGYLSSRRVLAAGSHATRHDLQGPAFVILPVDKRNGLLDEDLQRLDIQVDPAVLETASLANYDYALHRIVLAPR